MKDVVDKCSTKGCAIDIGTVIDNDNCTSKFSRFFATREEAESFMTKLKELADVLRFGGMRCTNRTMAQEIEEILKKARVKYD